MESETIKEPGRDGTVLPNETVVSQHHKWDEVDWEAQDRIQRSQVRDSLLQLNYPISSSLPWNRIYDP